MSEESAHVRLQIAVEERTRRRLKAESANVGLDMSELGQLILDYVLPLMATGKTPPELVRAIKKFKEDNSAVDGDD